MPATKFFTNTNVVAVDVEAFIAAAGEIPVWDDRYWGGDADNGGTYVFCNATGWELGPLSDIEPHPTYGEIVEVDLGARFWYARNAVDLLTRAERAERTYTGTQNEAARPLGR